MTFRRLSLSVHIIECITPCWLSASTGILFVPGVAHSGQHGRFGEERTLIQCSAAGSFVHARAATK